MEGRVTADKSDKTQDGDAGAEGRAAARRAGVLEKAEARIASEREAAARARAEAADRGDAPAEPKRTRPPGRPPQPWRR